MNAQHRTSKILRIALTQLGHDNGAAVFKSVALAVAYQGPICEVWGGSSESWVLGRRGCGRLRSISGRGVSSSLLIREGEA